MLLDPFYAADSLRVGSVGPWPAQRYQYPNVVHDYATSIEYQNAANGVWDRVQWYTTMYSATRDIAWFLSTMKVSSSTESGPIGPITILESVKGAVLIFFAMQELKEGPLSHDSWLNWLDW
jgi:hypothetical protein